jgi:hypothetical protein
MDDLVKRQITAYHSSPDKVVKVRANDLDLPGQRGIIKARMSQHCLQLLVEMNIFEKYEGSEEQQKHIGTHGKAEVRRIDSSEFYLFTQTVRSACRKAFDKGEPRYKKFVLGQALASNYIVIASDPDKSKQFLKRSENNLVAKFDEKKLKKLFDSDKANGKKGSKKGDTLEKVEADLKKQKWAKQKTPCRKQVARYLLRLEDLGLDISNPAQFLFGPFANLYSPVRYHKMHWVHILVQVKALKKLRDKKK